MTVQVHNMETKTMVLEADGVDVRMEATNGIRRIVVEHSLWEQEFSAHNHTVEEV